MTLYNTPTKVIFGKDAEKEVKNAILEQNAHKVLIHYGSDRIEKEGLLPFVEKQLQEANIDYVKLGGVVPNPRLSLIRKGIELCTREGIDFILAIGGGSVIDSAKAIGYGVFNEGDVWDFFTKKRTPQGCLGIGCILTQAAAGSEMSSSCVVTKEEGNLKRGCNTEYCRLRFALCNPELTYSLPPYQTSCAIVDIAMHTMERFFTSGSTLELTDNLSLALIKTTFENGLVALKEPNNYEARANLMWASSLSHNGLMNIGNDNRGDWSSHQLEHELSGLFDVAHGAGLAAVWSSWARYISHLIPERFSLFGQVVFNLQPTCTPEEVIQKVEEYYHTIKMPINISELGIKLTDENIEELAEKCTFFQTRTLGTVKKLGKSEIKEIYNMAR